MVLTTPKKLGSPNVDGKIFSNAQRSKEAAKKAPPVTRTGEQSYAVHMEGCARQPNCTVRRKVLPSQQYMGSSNVDGKNFFGCAT